MGDLQLRRLGFTALNKWAKHPCSAVVRINAAAAQRVKLLSLTTVRCRMYGACHSNIGRCTEVVSIRSTALRSADAAPHLGCNRVPQPSRATQEIYLGLSYCRQTACLLGSSMRHEVRTRGARDAIGRRRRKAVRQQRNALSLGLRLCIIAGSGSSDST